MTTRDSTPRGTKILTTRDLAEMFGVTEAAIRKRIRLGQLGPAIRMGKGYIVREEALIRFLEAEEAKAREQQV